MKAAFTTALLLIMLLDINIADARKRKKRTDLELNSDAVSAKSIALFWDNQHEFSNHITAFYIRLF